MRSPITQLGVCVCAKPCVDLRLPCVHLRRPMQQTVPSLPGPACCAAAVRLTRGRTSRLQTQTSPHPPPHMPGTSQAARRVCDASRHRLRRSLTSHLDGEVRGHMFTPVDADARRRTDVGRVGTLDDGQPAGRAWGTLTSFSVSLTLFASSPTAFPSWVRVRVSPWEALARATLARPCGQGQGL